ncbi:tyrosinase family protein [Microcoleus sp. FACHB-672]|uniref:tyrosinase family protein n=1 Tax=Microcoleus sp. FACHB-672 TaxID=2692825 RepID=UPI001683738B|nr:tyrosinase family protein [Microcoleus sp. FACHB-672]MBD2041919.1 tyrosinase family protein [Microcoleus sp. FACHB-672]
MNLKRASSWLGLITGSAIVFGAVQAQAYTFSRNYRPNDVLDFSALGYTYSGINVPGGTAGLQVRRSAASLNATEISRFVSAIQTLKTRTVTAANGAVVSEYDQFVATHLGAMDLAGRPGPDGRPLVNAAHGRAGFLPWHRAFIYEFERALQTVDPTVTIPYWDWTDINGSQNVLFTNNFLGGNGINPNGTPGGPVQTGPFTAANGWVQRSDLSGDVWLGTSTGRQPLRRNLGVFAPRTATNRGMITAAQENTALNTTSYLTLNTRLELNIHNPMHNWVGGSMNTMTSPNAPEFWMLHANIDRLWARWQTAVAGTGRLDGVGAYAAIGTQAYGHDRLQPMWPWDGGQSRVAADLAALIPGLPGVSPPNSNFSSFLMASAPEDLFSDTTGNMYNPWGHSAYHGDEPCPDEINMPCDMPCHQSEHVPEPASIFGLLAFGALGAGRLRKGKQPQKA